MSRQKKFYLEQRKSSGIYYFIIRDPDTRKTTAYKSTGTTDKKLAENIAMDWWTNGIPGKLRAGIDRKTTFCEYLYQFWDFETSGYFRELETMGKEPQPEHAMEMQKIVKRYYTSYFKEKLLCQIDSELLQEFVVHLKIDRKLAASTVTSARNTAIKALRYAKRKGHIKYFDFENVLRAGGKSKEKGVLEREEAELLFSLDWPCIRSRMACLISYQTGARISEVRNLKIFNILQDRILINKSWSGKKNREKCTKTGN